MAVTVTCSVVFPECAFTTSNGTDSVAVNEWLDHVDEKHQQQHPRTNARRKDALAFS